MSGFIPPFDWHAVVVSPWTENAAQYGWIVAMGFLVTLACGLVGNYLIFRRMALVGDAISHSVLPGLAIAFLVAYHAGSSGFWGTPPETADGGHHDYRSPALMFLGALVAGIGTTVLIELIHKKSRVKQDAAIGITFSSLFAIGVILISVFADEVDLDAECVLYGEITFVSMEPPVRFGELSLGPPSVLRMGVVTMLTVLFILLFYKELLVSSFDPGLSRSMGINPTFMHYALMSWLSVVVVSAFESVGAILVVAMLILPGATASLLTDRLPRIFLLTTVHAALSAVAGLHLAIWLNCAAAGAMVVMGSVWFVLAWVFSPGQGLLRRWWTLRTQPLEPPSLETVQPRE
jgi:manganese/zinc/iron transport system permease protein